MGCILSHYFKRVELRDYTRRKKQNIFIKIDYTFNKNGRVYLCKSRKEMKAFFRFSRPHDQLIKIENT